MDPKSSLIHSNMPDLNNKHFGYGGAVKPITYRKKSKVRLNDQLIPKPSDVNMMEKMIKIATPKQHPYSSHISKFAMFPSYRSPDDPDTGVRAASKPFLNPLIPNRAPDVNLLSKTIGSPFRHEILENPINNSKKAVMWTGECGFLEHTKPLKGGNQVFYPTPPKTVLPNPKLRDWDLALSERTSNMLKNLEKSHWLTSYQINYTGSGPANPLMIDDFKEKMSDPPGMDLMPLRERSFPVFVPSKPAKGCREQQRGSEGRETFSSAAELPNLSQSPNHGTTSATSNQPRPLEITAELNEAQDPNRKGHSQSKNSSGATEAPSTVLSQEVLHKQQNRIIGSTYEGRERENCKVQFDESLSQHCQKANADTERPLDPCSCPLYLKRCLCVKDEPCSKKTNLKVNRNVLSLSAGAKDLAAIESELLCRSYEQEELGKSKEKPQSIRNSCILPRPPVLPGILSEGRVRTVGLLELQNSFSKTAAHLNFNSSVTRAPVNLRDNVVTGKKHNFFGINSCYLHG